MTAIPAEHHWVEPTFRDVAIVYRELSARWLLSTVASELAPDPAACLVLIVPRSPRCRSEVPLAA